jgi:hypothetical protein
MQGDPAAGSSPEAPRAAVALLPALVLVLFFLTPAVSAAPAPVSATRAHEIVIAESARNRARALRSAERRLGSIELPAGAATSANRPTGIGELLSEPAAIPGGHRHVATHRFWTVPGSAREVLAWLGRHAPPLTKETGTISGSAGETLVFESPAPHGAGDLGGLLFITVVPRSSGGSAVRADVFEDWEVPRSPLERIPAGSRFLRLTVSPGSGGLHGGGEKVRPSRTISSSDPGLIAKLVRIVNDQPAYQQFDLPSCGPVGLGSEYNLTTLVFRASRQGRVLARVSQETPIGICDSLRLQVAGHKPYALEGGWNVLRAARGLIHQAQPQP